MRRRPAHEQLHHGINRAIGARYEKLPTEQLHGLSGSRLEKAGQRGGLLHPVRHLRLVELIVFVDIAVAHVLVLAGTGRGRSQKRAAEEGHLDVASEDMERQEPTLAL